MKEIKKSLVDAIKKAITTAASNGGDFLPQPLANYYIDMVREKNWCRQLFRTEPMSSKTKDIPKLLSGTKVYKQPTEATAGISTGIKTGSLQLLAKKFMATAEISNEVIEDAAFEIISIVKNDFAAALGSAEEEAMILGDPDHSPTTNTEADATDSTWFSKDPKLQFYGLLTLASDISGSLTDDTRAANRVNADGADMSTAIGRLAKYNLGKYGRNFNDLVLILNPWSCNQLLDDQKIVTLEKYGPNATIFSGEIGKLYGKLIVIESNFMTDGYGVITHQQNPIIGDRRLITLKSKDYIENDSQLYVITSRMDFNVQYKSALCQIYNLDTPSEES
jgi:hypothetical protein